MYLKATQVTKVTETLDLLSILMILNRWDRYLKTQKNYLVQFEVFCGDAGCVDNGEIALLIDEVFILTNYTILKYNTLPGLNL